MRRISFFRTCLTLLLLFVGVSVSWGEKKSVVFSSSDYKEQGVSGSGSEVTMVKDDLSICDTKFYGNTSYAHLYAGGILTITPQEDVTITGITITTTGTSYNGYQSSGTPIASIGKISKNSSDNAVVEWKGETKKAFTISHDKQIRWKTIVVDYYTGDKEITEEQTAAVSLPFSVSSGNTSAVIGNIKGIDLNCDAEDYKNDTHKVKFSKESHYIQIVADSRIGVCKFSLLGAGGAGTALFTLEGSSNGENWHEVQSFEVKYTKSTDVVILRNSKSFEVDDRYIKLNFHKTTGYVNSGLGEFSITPYIEEATITIASACTDGENCYSTYSNESAWVVPANLTVSEIGVEDGKLNVVAYETGDVVPANTGVMVSVAEGGDYSVLLTEEVGTSVLGESNCLRPSSEEMTGDCLFYRLTMHNGTQIGYWWGAADGAAFSLAANKAYLAVPKTAGVKANMWIGGDEDAIKSVEKEYDTVIYDMQGRKVSKAQKGLYIVNGKKVVR